MDDSDPEALFQLVLSEQEKSLRKLRRLRFTSRWERNWVVPGNENRLVHERKVIRDGDSVWCELHGYPSATRGRQVSDQVLYFVWNDQYFVTWVKTTVAAHMYEYDGLNMRSKDVQSKMGLAGPYPERRYAYGTGKDPLAKAGSLDPQKYPSRFEAERYTDTEGRVFYTLKGWMNDRASYPRPSWVLTVDPAKGYMVTHGLYQLADLTVGKMSDFTVMPREISPGIWFPMEWTITEYVNVDPNTGEQSAATISKYTVTDMQFDPVIDRDQFTWKSLNLPPATMFMRFDKSGEVKFMKHANGELIPGEIEGSQSGTN